MDPKGWHGSNLDFKPSVLDDSIIFLSVNLLLIRWLSTKLPIYHITGKSSRTIIWLLQCCEGTVKVKGSALLAFCEGNPPVIGGSPPKRPQESGNCFQVMTSSWYSVCIRYHAVTTAHHEAKPTGGLTAGQTNSPSSIVQITRLLFMQTLRVYTVGFGYKNQWWNSHVL